MAAHYFPWHDAVLHALREYPVLSHAAKAVGINRVTLWRAMQADERFAEDVRDAMEEGIDRAEAEAFRRGVVGYEEPVIDKGRLAYRYERYVDEEGKEHYRPVLDEDGQPVPLTVRKHSDNLLGLVLKARRREYGTDRTEISNPDGSLAPVDESTRAARVAQLLALAERRRADEAALQAQFGDLA